MVLGQLLTGRAASDLSTGSVVFSFIAFVAIYLAMFTFWVLYVVRQVRRGPDLIEQAPPDVPTSPNRSQESLSNSVRGHGPVGMSAPVPA